MSDPFGALIEEIVIARAEGKSFEQMMQMAADFLGALTADYDAGQRDELLAQAKFVIASLHAAQPKEAVEAKRNQFLQAMTNTKTEGARRHPDH